LIRFRFGEIDYSLDVFFHACSFLSLYHSVELRSVVGRSPRTAADAHVGFLAASCDS
jgi:hypothetical protein